MLARVRASEAQSALLACWMSNSGVSRTIWRAMKTDYLNAKIEPSCQFAAVRNAACHAAH